MFQQLRRPGSISSTRSFCYGIKKCHYESWVGNQPWVSHGFWLPRFL
jgi:hypothetical protein